MDETGPGTARVPVPLGDERLKHLEFLQAVIARLANHSFLVKGWALTLAAGFFAVSASQQNWQVAASGLVPLLCFWSLDGFFLRQERLFRYLYDDVRRPGSAVETMSMNVAPYTGRISWLRAALSPTLRLYYGALFLTEASLVAVNL
ncbi:hypothetical protein [Streptomyces sp. WAC05374]|uniref:hypothetical protein n=1 Tax=Streptomyces sp. WAC05374 TaxID=2487420 RepID=UPI001F468EBD|nr:hypothetical protein [Streptomyces sp. WAC05374]